LRTGQVFEGHPGSLATGLVYNSANQLLLRPQINDLGSVLLEANARSSAQAPVVRSLWLLPGTGHFHRIAGVQDAAASLPGLTYAGFSSARLDQSNRIVFGSALAGAGVQAGLNDAGVWLVNGSTTGLVVRRSWSAPGTQSYGYFRNLFEPVFGSTGSGAELVLPSVVGSLPGGSPAISGSDGAWKYTNGVLEKIQWCYTLPPGIPDCYFNVMWNATTSASNALLWGQLGGTGVFTIVVNGVSISNSSAIWDVRGEDSTLLARTGSPAPGAGIDVVFRTLPATSSSTPALGTSGMGAFVAQLAGPGVNMYNDTALYTVSNAVPSLRVRAGQPAPGLPAGVNLSTISGSAAQGTLVVGDQNHVAFTSFITGPGVTLADARCLWRLGPEGLRLVARAGVPVVGLPSGVVIGPGFAMSQLRVSPGGHVMFVAQLTGTGVTTANDYALFHFDGSTLRAVAREGDTFGNHRIKVLNTTSNDLQVSANGHGVMCMTAYSIADQWQSDRPALLAVSPSGQAHLVAVQNSPIETTSGSTPNVTLLRLAPTGALNAAGTVVYAAKFQGTTQDEAVLTFSIPGGSQTPPPPPPNPCPPDYNRSGSVTIHDVFAFLTDWFAGSADYNNSGATDEADLFEFVVDWFNGCP
jgi:hypothetical protein